MYTDQLDKISEALEKLTASSKETLKHMKTIAQSIANLQDALIKIVEAGLESGLEIEQHEHLQDKEEQKTSEGTA